MTHLLRTPSLARPTARRGAAVVLAGLLSLTACGGSDEDSTSAPTPTETTSAAPSATGGAPSTSAEEGQSSLTATLVDFDIELPETELAAGTYEIEVTNDGSASHDLIVERDGEDVAGTEIIKPDASETLSVVLEPGEYVFYCSVANHRGMGMEITVTVT